VSVAALHSVAGGFSPPMFEIHVIDGGLRPREEPLDAALRLAGQRASALHSDNRNRRRKDDTTAGRTKIYNAAVRGGVP
jgi:hypothetical protein